MLTISQTLLDRIHAHGEETFPSECCGLILGTTDGEHRVACGLHKAHNPRAAERNDRYEITADDRQAAERLAREQNWQVIGFYHSHPDHDAYFSQTDLEHSEEYAWGEPWVPPTYSYVVTSIHGGQHSHYKVFIVQDGEAVEEPVSVM